MNRLRNTLILLVSLFWAFGAVTHAVELRIPDLEASPFDEIVVPILVTDFDAVAGVEIHLSFDSINLTLDSIISDHLVGATLNPFIIGEAHVVWDNFMNPLTLSDDDTLLQLYFTIRENASGEAFINFDFVELTNAHGDPLTVILTGGGITMIILDADDEQSLVPALFDLGQNYPNPFNPSTPISYSVKRGTNIYLEIFKISGQRIDRKFLGYVSPGEYAIPYDGSSLPSGVYYYRLSGDNISRTKQMILLK